MYYFDINPTQSAKKQTQFLVLAKGYTVLWLDRVLIMLKRLILNVTEPKMRS